MKQFIQFLIFILISENQKNPHQNQYFGVFLTNYKQFKANQNSYLMSLKSKAKASLYSNGSKQKALNQEIIVISDNENLAINSKKLESSKQNSLPSSSHKHQTDEACILDGSIEDPLFDLSKKFIKGNINLSPSTALQEIISEAKLAKENFLKLKQIYSEFSFSTKIQTSSSSNGKNESSNNQQKSSSMLIKKTEAKINRKKELLQNKQKLVQQQNNVIEKNASLMPKCENQKFFNFSDDESYEQKNQGTNKSFYQFQSIYQIMRKYINILKLVRIIKPKYQNQTQRKNLKITVKNYLLYEKGQKACKGYDIIIIEFVREQV